MSHKNFLQDVDSEGKFHIRRGRAVFLGVLTLALLLSCFGLYALSSPRVSVAAAPTPTVTITPTATLDACAKGNLDCLYDIPLKPTANDDCANYHTHLLPCGGTCKVYTTAGLYTDSDVWIDGQFYQYGRHLVPAGAKVDCPFGCSFYAATK